MVLVLVGHEELQMRSTRVLAYLIGHCVWFVLRVPPQCQCQVQTAFFQ